MKEKLLKEKGAVKVWVIVLVIVLCLAIAGGIFAYIKINEDKDDDSTSTSQSKENKKKSKDADEDEDEDEDVDIDQDEDDDDTKTSKNKSSKERHFSGNIDMDEIIGTTGTKWTMDVYGTDEAISKIVITIDMEDYLEEMYEEYGGQYDDYDEFIEEVQEEFEDEMDGLGESLVEGIGVDADDVKLSIDWVKDEVLEINIDFSKVDFSELDIEDDESVIEAMVEALEEEGVKLKEVK